MNMFGIGCEAVAAAGLAQSVAGLLAVRAFRGRAPAPEPAALPPITVLKPLHGDEPLLEEALATVCAQDYPAFQVVFGVQDPQDPALAVVDRLRARFPHVDIAVAVSTARHGCNRKVGNLINMFPLARHDVLVIADSDVHAAPDYLRRLAATLAQPGTGLATTLYTGVPGRPGPWATLGVTALTHGFLPGALLGARLGRQDCLGATMALRRQTLAALGGLRALADHIADDHILGRRVRALGLHVRLSDTVCATTVPEGSAQALFRHELRWARTIRALVPVQFALSSVQHPLAWAGLGLLLSGLQPSAAVAFLLAWALRAIVCTSIETELTRPGAALPPRVAPASALLLPLRDLLSAVVLLASYGGTRVDWRGQVMHTAGLPGAGTPDPGRQAPLGEAASAA